MNLRFMVSAIGILCGLWSLPLLAREAPIVLDPPVTIEGLPRDGQNSGIRYQAQPAKAGKIDLTATNGFFDRCFEALGQQPKLPGDDPFIGCSFEYLRRLSDQVRGTARWHLWCPEAGEIKATFFLQVPAGEADHPWTIQVGDETKTLKVEANDGQTPHKQTLSFTVRQPGKVTFSIDCTAVPPPADTRIYYIRLEGSAIARSSLLRTRWRPAAVHGRYFPSGTCPEPAMWVFETMDVGKTGSYSPLTTPFGYFGTGFQHGGMISAGSGFNFSIWIANRNGTAAPPIEKMARLIGTDIPDAQYSTFGGEGTGVKFRGGAYKQATDRTIQALRLESDGAGLLTYYGYFYDEPEKRWKLYASAQCPGGKNPNGLLGSTGSFCEIPGPPNRERSGDLVREIKRRGWFYGSDRKWYRAQIGNLPDEAEPAEGEAAPAAADPAAKKPPAKRKAPVAADPEVASSKRVYYLPDYPTDGWMAMRTGGIETYLGNAAGNEKPKVKAGAPVVPEYLSPEKTAQLFDLPVVFGTAKAIQPAAGQATIEYEIKKTGPNSKAILYYGTIDSLTYPPKKVDKGSPVEIDMFRPERTWQSATPEQDVKTGMNLFKLGGLKPGTTYYYRLFVQHDQGKSWDYVSGRFEMQGTRH
jgi:hypothetical protein